VEFTYADLGTAVTASSIIEAIDLPAGAIITSGYLNVTTAWVGPTAATVSVGDGGSAARYLGDTSIKATGLTDLVPTGYKYTAADTVDFDLEQTVAVSSAGAAELVVYYIIEDKANEVQPT
jgi:hypothetical protein